MTVDIQTLTEAEIATFINAIDHSGDGFIDCAELERKLSAVFDELVQKKPPAHHHLYRLNSHHTSTETAHHDDEDKKGDQVHYALLRRIVGTDAQRISHAELAAKVREWRIPSTEQDAGIDASQKAYMRSLGFWRRVRSHWAVHGPEIAFLALVIALQLGFGLWQCIKFATSPQYRVFGWGLVLAKASAGALYPTCFFSILSMSRYFSTFMRRWYYVSRFINWDLGQSFHIKMSCVALVLATLHAIGHLAGTFVWGSRQSSQDGVAAILGQDALPMPYIMWLRCLPGWTGITGLGMFYLLALLSMPVVRRWNYELFQLGHLLMFPFIALMSAHGWAALMQRPMFGPWLIIPSLLVFMERVTRVAIGFHRISATLTVLDSDTVQIQATIPKERMWKYFAGQYVFLQVPAVSKFQWHPFTVSSGKGREMRLHIKTDGNWTGKLRSLAGPSGRAQIKIGINGLFGAPAQRFYDFSHTIIVGAGIGVTPFSGILADLQAKDNAIHGELGHSKEQDTPSMSEEAFEGAEAAPKVARNLTDSKRSMSPTVTLSSASKSSFADDYRRVDFHWIVRNRNHLLWMAELLNNVSRSQQWHKAHDASQHLDIRIHTHVTQKREDILTHVCRWLLEAHRTPEQPTSPLTGLMNPTEFGRPDFVRILDAHYQDMLKYKAMLNEKGEDRWRDEEFKVGVFFCGTPIVGEILADRCRLLSARGQADGSKIEYHFMREVFGQ